MLFERAIDNVKLARRRRPRSCDDSDSFAFGIEDLQADRLVVVVFTRWQRIEALCLNPEGGTDPGLRVTHAIDAGELHQKLTLVRAARFDCVRRSCALFLQPNLKGWDKSG